METNNNNQKKQADQKQKQENPKQNAKGEALNGTETSSSWEKAAEMIAGNNQLMSSLLKLLLSPLTLIAGAALIGYLFYKNHQQKKEIEKLKEDFKTIACEISESAEQAEEYHKKYKKLKKLFEVEQSQIEQHLLPQGTHPTHHAINKNKISYLK